jgi:hypothetical protein
MDKFFEVFHAVGMLVVCAMLSVPLIAISAFVIGAWFTL